MDRKYRGLDKVIVWDACKGQKVETIVRKPISSQGFDYYRYKGKVHKAYVDASFNPLIYVQDFV